MKNYTKVEVSEPTTYVDGKGFVDLGLPSGTLWCTTNEMAHVPEEKGIYGNSGVLEIGVVPPDLLIRGRFYYNQIPGTRDLPTHEEFQELLDECLWTLGTLNNKIGFQVKGPNGNSIFLPIEDTTVQSNNLDDTVYAGSTVGIDISEEELKKCNNSIDAHSALMSTAPDCLIIYRDSPDSDSIIRDLFLYGTGSGKFLLRTVIPRNRKIKRDKFENGEILEFVPRNPKAAIQTKKRHLGYWDGD